MINGDERWSLTLTSLVTLTAETGEVSLTLSVGVYGEREFRGSQGKRYQDTVNRTGVVREDFVHNRRDPPTGRRRGA